MFGAEVLTPEQARERLEADVVLVAQHTADPIFSQARFVCCFSDETLERVLLALLAQYADAL